MKLKKLNYLTCLLLVVLALGFTSCSSNKDSSSTKVNNNDNNGSYNTDKEKVSSNAVTVDNKEDEKSSENTQSSSKVTRNTGGIKFTKKELDGNTKITFNTPWKDSDTGNYSACIEGKGSEALEEGVGKIIIKNGQNLYSYEIENNNEISPKYLEWADGQNLLVVIGASQGTLAKGGDLYMLNVNTGEITLLIKTTSKKQQIMSAEKNGNNINLKVNVYDDDVYNESHVENWVINSFNTNLNGKIEVKNSDGKVVYEINE
ncbi:DUF4652 domain-containing protein [Clostridium sp. WILCCON 0269]|uniref:DUF4652 domain-containing protein n=1 Tax=Candidatus Clostridium eludens TaxID=3381663 RepID=A0ABW8SJE5_9CLOT